MKSLFKTICLYVLLSILLNVISVSTGASNNDEFMGLKNSHNFTGKVVLITGSSSGIGEAIVKLFSLLGASVVITGRKAKEIKRVAQEVQQLSPNNLKPLEVVADVSKSDDLNRLIQETIKTYGKLDVLVNNAGIGQKTSIRDQDIMSVFSKTLDVNLKSYVELIHLSVPYLDQTNGTIISISSVVGLKPTFMGFSYEVSKAGVNTLSKALAVELGPKIRVNVVSPGPVITNWLANNPVSDTKAMEQAFKDMMSKIPMKRPGWPLDIAKAVTFLASPDASFITGANLIVDGGIVLA